jgi:hypothetical protein
MRLNGDEVSLSPKMRRRVLIAAGFAVAVEEPPSVELLPCNVVDCSIVGQ